jgi:hypothetical protein
VWSSTHAPPNGAALRVEGTQAGECYAELELVSRALSRSAASLEPDASPRPGADHEATPATVRRRITSGEREAFRVDEHGNIRVSEHALSSLLVPYHKKVRPS